MAAFALLNGARVIAYVPQIRCLNRDNSNAAAVSLATWALFTLANAATVTYAIFVINDLLMAGMFMLNLLGCLTIVLMIAKKRVLHRSASSLGTLPYSGSDILGVVSSSSKCPSENAKAVSKGHGAETDRVPRKGVFERLMLAWQSRAQSQLDLHLKLMLPGKRVRYPPDDTQFWRPPRDDKYRHHPNIRE
jgi:hypothetical protein